MSNLFQLRLIAREIFDEALRAVNAEAAVRHGLRIDGSRLSVCEASFELSAGAQVYSIAIGKAAGTMAVALEDVLGDRLFKGVIAEYALNAVGQKLSKRWQYFEGGHPIPNEASLAAAEAAFALLDRANREHALVIFLISGGGSAMLEAPISKEITLEDLRSANQTLVTCGASISEINAVRRAFSAVKGGRLAMRAPNSKQVTLIVSDVPPGEEHSVASGPTLSPSADKPSAAEVVERYGLLDQMPSSIMRAIERSETSEPPTPIDHPYFILLDNNTALEAAATAARKSGSTVEIARDISDELIEAGVEKLLTRLGELKASDAADVCLVSGGEFACPVRGEGLGGRSLETALRLAIAADQNSGRVGEFVALCAGTDGIDGNSTAAGAIVDSTTIERARRIGLDPADFLNRSDSYSFFVALGDVVTTGPTGTNVRDLRILLT
ncbi:MAG: glycerate kinase type-2 family protein [Pyrinomonadaceae bacterium]